LLTLLRCMLTLPSVPCLYYTLLADPVQRTAEEFHWCMAHRGGELAADGNMTGGVHARCTGRRGWSLMQNLTLVEWAQVRGRVRLLGALHQAVTEPLGYREPCLLDPSRNWQVLFVILSACGVQGLAS
jgi:hypothetical protein